MSLLLVRYRFPGRRLLSALVDLPLAVSPVVVGLALMLVYSGRDGWFGPALEDAGFQVIFATPGMVMATAFVVAAARRSARSCRCWRRWAPTRSRRPGASAPTRVQTFRRITLPGHQVGRRSTASS